MTPLITRRFYAGGRALWLRALSLGFGLLAAHVGSAAVDATVTPASLTTDSVAAVTVHVTGLPPGGSVLIERYVDSNGNGVVDPGEMLAEAHTVTDGQVTTIGGVRNLNIPGDEDGAVDGQVSYRFRPRLNAELGRLAGTQLIRISSPTSAFSPMVRNFALTQPGLPQSISGTVRSGEDAVPFAAVILLQPVGGDVDFAGGAIADANGNYTVTPPAGPYLLMPMQRGYVANFEEGAFVQLAPSGAETADLQLVPATTSISGRITYTGTTDGAPGVQLFIESQAGDIVVTNTAIDGTFNIPVTAGIWEIGVSDASLAQLGCVRPDDDTIATANTQSGAVTGIAVDVTKGNALIYGTITTPSATPVPGVFLGANSQSSGHDADGVTNENGAYSLAVIAGTWHIWFSETNPALEGFVPPSGSSVTVSAGQAVARNFTLAPVTAQLQGTVSKNGAPVADALLGAFNQETFTWVSTYSGTDGSFQLGLTAGQWVLQLEMNYAGQNNLVSASFNYSLTDGQTVSNINFAVLDATATVSGLVRDQNGQPINEGYVYAFTTIGGIGYNAHSTLQNGNYTLKLATGTWSIGVNVAGFNPTDALVLPVSMGQNLTRNFDLSNLPQITSQPSTQTVQSGWSFGFSVNVSSPYAVTFQWQVSTDNGNTWSNLSNDSTYNNTNGNFLHGTATVALNGNRYRCVVTSSAGSTTSNDATLFVTPSNVPPTVVVHPLDVTTDAGSTVYFNFIASGTPSPGHKWQISADGMQWTDLSDNQTYSGTATDTLTVHAGTALNGMFYRGFATNSSGTAFSSPARLTVRETFNSWRQTQFTPTQLQDPQVSGWSATPANDGLTNLFKYAFDLDPFTPGGGRAMPGPMVDSQTLILSFEAIRDDIAYTVETSTNLTTWTTSGVQVIAEGTWREARVNLGGPAVFLRIVVTLQPPS